jgi:hypothetical protein
LTASNDIADVFIRRFKAVRRVGTGILVLACGVWLASSQTALKKNAAAGLQTLRESVENGIPILSAAFIDKKYDGQLVYLQGNLKAGQTKDPVTGLTVAAASLRRTVETQQWQEYVKSNRAGSFTHDYKLVWSDHVIDSDNFDDVPLLGKSQKHVNPKNMPYADVSPWVEPGDMHLDAWRVPTYHYAQWISQEIPVKDAMLADGVNPEDWYISEGYLQKKAYSEVAMRFRYDYMPVEEDVYSLIGIPHDGVLDLDDNYTSLPLIARGAVDAETLLAQAEGTTVKTSRYWIAWIFIGTLLLLRPVANRFQALQFFTAASLGRRWAMSLAVATLCTVLVGWLT